MTALFDTGRAEQTHRLAALFTSKTDEWNTPERIARLVHEFGEVGLDPCSNGRSLVDVRIRVTETDGLAMPWRGHGLVFVNPPYGRSVIAWAREAWRQFNDAALPDECILFVPSRTDTAWFHDYVFTATAVCFIRGRVEFVGTAKRRGRCPFPSVLAYYGDRRDRFGEVFSQLGPIVFREVSA